MREQFQAVCVNGARRPEWQSTARRRLVTSKIILKIVIAMIFAGVLGSGTEPLGCPAQANSPVESIPPQLVVKEPRPPLAPAARLVTKDAREILERCQKEMNNAQTLSYRVVLTHRNATFNTTHVWTGNYRYLKPDLVLAEYHLQGEKTEPEAIMKFVRNGAWLYSYRPDVKAVLAEEIPPLKSGPAKEQRSFWERLALGFQKARMRMVNPFADFSPAEASSRYEIKVSKEDEWYVYLDIMPQLAEDRAEFLKARVVLLKATLLPRQFWYAQPDRSETTMDFLDVEVGTKLERGQFTPSVPDGWQMKRFPQGNDYKQNP